MRRQASASVSVMGRGAVPAPCFVTAQFHRCIRQLCAHTLMAVLGRKQTLAMSRGASVYTRVYTASARASLTSEDPLPLACKQLSHVRKMATDPEWTALGLKQGGTDAFGPAGQTEQISHKIHESPYLSGCWSAIHPLSQRAPLGAPLATGRVPLFEAVPACPWRGPSGGIPPIVVCARTPML